MWKRNEGFIKMNLGYQTTKNEDNKKFYWIRLMIDFFHKDTMDFLMGQKDGANYVALYMMLLLMSANTKGKLQTEIGEIIVPVNIDKIVRDTKYFSKDTVIVGLELFKKLGLVYEDNNGVLVLPEVPYLVGVSSGQTIRKSNALIDKEVKGGKNGGKNYHKSIEYRDKSIIDKDLKDNKQDINNKDNKKNNKFNWKKEVYFEDEELQKTFLDYLELRQSIKAVNTERAIKLLINNLEKIASDKDTKIKVIEQSIMNSWKGVFPLKNDFNKKEVKKEDEWDLSKFKNDFTVE